MAATWLIPKRSAAGGNSDWSRYRGRGDGARDQRDRHVGGGLGRLGGSMLNRGRPNWSGAEGGGTGKRCPVCGA